MIYAAGEEYSRQALIEIINNVQQEQITNYQNWLKELEISITNRTKKLIKKSKRLKKKALMINSKIQNGELAEWTKAPHC